MLYQVKAGDSLSSIAASYYGDSSKASWIASQNQLNNPNHIYPGQQLELAELPGESAAALVGPALLSALCPNLNSSALTSFCNALALDLPKAHITPPLCVAHFMAQTSHESAGYSQLRENLNYKYLSTELFV